MLSKLKKITKEEMLIQTLREAIMNDFGSAVGRSNLEMLAENAYDVKRINFSINDTLIESAFRIVLPDSAKKLFTKLASDTCMRRLIKQNDPVVFSESAKRLTAGEGRLLIKKQPRNHHLRMIVEDKERNEINIASGDTVKNHFNELSDDWYDRLAKKIFTSYGQMHDDHWEEKAIQQASMNFFSHSDQKIDSSKLSKAINKIKKENEEKILGEHYSLASIVNNLRESQTDLLNNITYSTPVNYKNLTSEQFCNTFNVKITRLHPKYRFYLSENTSLPNIPTGGCLPEHETFSEPICEAIDKFVKNWGKKYNLNFYWNIEDDTNFSIKFMGIK